MPMSIIFLKPKKLSQDTLGTTNLITGIKLKINSSQEVSMQINATRDALIPHGARLLQFKIHRRADGETIASCGVLEWKKPL